MMVGGAVVVVVADLDGDGWSLEDLGDDFWGDHWDLGDAIGGGGILFVPPVVEEGEELE